MNGRQLPHLFYISEVKNSMFLVLQSIILQILQHRTKDMLFLVKTFNFSWKGKIQRKGHS